MSGSGPVVVSPYGSLAVPSLGAGLTGYPLMPPVVPDDESGILARLRRRKGIFLLVFILVLAVVTGAYFAVPRTYRVSASVVVSSADVVLGDPKAPAAQQNVGDPADLESQVVVLSSSLLLRDVLTRPGIREALISECQLSLPSPLVGEIKERLLGPAPSCVQQVDDTASELVALQNRYSVTASGRSRVIDVAYSSPSAQVAPLMANALVQAYLDLRTNEKLTPRDAAITWLRSEIARLGNKLKASEATIEAFLSSHDMVKGQTASISSERLSSLSQQLAAAEADQASSAGRFAQIGHNGTDTQDVLNSRTVSDLKQQLTQVNGQVAQLSARYGAAYPGLSALIQQRNGLQAALGAETGRVVSSVGHDYQAAADRVAALRRQVDALKKDVGAGDNAMTQIAALQRDTDVDRELYLDLTKRLNELEAERRLVVGDARLVDLAEIPDKVFFPKKLTFGLTGILLATALATAAALLRDRADGTVRTSDSLQMASGVRVLAHIPRVRRVGAEGQRLASQLGQPSAFQEAIRGLYAECMLVDEATPLRSLMVTSSLSGEGKTFVTLALAHFAAAAGKRVLVLECDLRQPSFARALSLRSERGMSDYLRGKIRMEDVVTPSNTERLHVAMAGRTAVNSTELLSSRRMRQLLDWATGQYDLVLIDTPPNQLLRDARILGRQVDAVLYCAQWAQSQMATVLGGVQTIQAAGGNVIGLVLDRVETDQYRLYDAHASHAHAYPALQDG